MAEYEDVHILDKNIANNGEMHINIQNEHHDQWNVVSGDNKYTRSEADSGTDRSWVMMGEGVTTKLNWLVLTLWKNEDPLWSL